MSLLSPYYSYEVLGSAELLDGYDSLERKTQRQFSRKALQAGQKPIISAMRDTAGFEDRTGLLRSSIRGAAGKGDRPGITSQLIAPVTTVGQFLENAFSGGPGLSEGMNPGMGSGPGRAKLAALLISKYGGNIGAKYRTYYARFVEFGHQPSGWYAKMKGAKRVPEHPFARPAFDEQVDQSADVIENSLVEQITEEWASGSSGSTQT